MISILESIGNVFLNLFKNIGGLLGLSVILPFLLVALRFNKNSFFHNLNKFGIKLLPWILFLSFISALILAFVADSVVNLSGSLTLFGKFYTYLLLTKIIPLLFALIYVFFTGINIAYYQVTPDNTIDFFSDKKPENLYYDYLTPSFGAIFISYILLFAVFQISVFIFTTVFTSTITNMNLSEFWKYFYNEFMPVYFLSSLFKSVFFAFANALIITYFGVITTKKQQISKAVTSVLSYSFILILLTDLAITYVKYN